MKEFSGLLFLFLILFCCKKQNNVDYSAYGYPGSVSGTFTRNGETYPSSVYLQYIQDIFVFGTNHTPNVSCNSNYGNIETVFFGTHGSIQSFKITGIPKKVGTFSISKDNSLFFCDSLLYSSTYFTDPQADYGIAKYSLLKIASNSINVSKYDSITGIVEGSYDLTFFVDTTILNNNFRTDTTRYILSKFQTKWDK